jgi:hypothetical protein
MPVELVVRDSKFYNQFKNGIGFTDALADFTNNLTGLVGETVKYTYEIDVSWVSKSAQDPAEWTFQYLGSSNYRVRQGTASSNGFTDEGFAINDSFQWVQTTPVTFSIVCTVDSITSTWMYFSAASAPWTPTDETRNDNSIFAGFTPLTAMRYKFGLIGNSENFNTISKVSGNDQGYFGSSIGFDTGAGVRDLNWVDFERTGNYADWDTGSMRVKFISTTNYTQKFHVEHIFVITPFYLEGQLANLQNNIIPNLLTGDNSLKYVFAPGFRTELNNPNTQKDYQESNNLGSIGWYGERFNGYNNNYQVNSILYQDAVTLATADGVIIGSKTKVTIQVKNIVGNFNVAERAGVYMYYLPTQDEYTDTILTDLKENFLSDHALNNGGLAAVNGNSNPTTPIITNYTITNVVTNTMTLTFDVEYSSLQKAFLSNRNSQEDIYCFIAVQLGNNSLTSGNSDRVLVKADVKAYDESADISGLIVNPDFKVFPYKEVVGVDTGYSSATQWIEDGLTVVGSFDLDLNKEAVLNTLECRLIAENATTGKFFELDSFVFNVANPVIVSGVQQFNLITTRNYNLENGSQFNDVTLTTGALAAGLQTYNIRFSQKLSWQDWISNTADSIFYNNTKPNNNLNDKSSNYSALNGFNIKLSMFSNLSGINEFGVAGITDYHVLTPSITVYDYELDGNVTPEWSAVIQTFNAANLSDLGGSILTGQNTAFKTTWTNSVAPVTDLTDITAIHRIEETNQNGYNIDEVGTLYSYPSNNRVIPKGGFANLDMFLSSGTVVTECLIKGSTLTSGIGYNISAKIEVESTIDPNGKLTSPLGESKETSGTSETKVTSP